MNAEGTKLTEVDEEGVAERARVVVSRETVQA